MSEAPLLDAALERAVAEAIEPVNYTSIAQAICRTQNGGSKCLCERGLWKHCHAVSVYGDMAIGVMGLLKRNGVETRR